MEGPGRLPLGAAGPEVARVSDASPERRGGRPAAGEAGDSQEEAVERALVAARGRCEAGVVEPRISTERQMERLGRPAACELDKQEGRSRHAA